jgi:cyclopropane fatty-acyl-phospholipid synthase-like methyltransferase
VSPRPGELLADLGCGTGDLAQMLVDGVTYVGIDHNPAYISSTALDIEPGGRYFVNGDLADLADLALPPVDVAVAIGVLHHLPDDLVVTMLEATRAKLAPGGRIVTIDPVFHPDQRSSARIMMAMDRGRFVRQQPHYEYLFRSVFPSGEGRTRSDINPFPYTHLIMSATVPAA